MTSALIVDDEEDMRFLIRATIEAANHGLYVSGEAANGEDALAQCRTDPPTVVVLDNRMPGITGLETAERILAHNPQQSIVLFSAYLDPETRLAAAELGIQACLAKSDYHRLPETLWQLAATA